MALIAHCSRRVLELATYLRSIDLISLLRHQFTMELDRRDLWLRLWLRLVLRPRLLIVQECLPLPPLGPQNSTKTPIKTCLRFHIEDDGSDDNFPLFDKGYPMPPTLRWARSSKMRKKDDTFGYEGKDLEQRNNPRSY